MAMEHRLYLQFFIQCGECDKHNKLNENKDYYINYFKQIAKYAYLQDFWM